MGSSISGVDDTMTIADTQGLDEMLADVASVGGSTRGDVYSVAASMRKGFQISRGATPGMNPIILI